jgi:all-trans-retinol 13,14-reductase
MLPFVTENVDRRNIWAYIECRRCQHKELAMISYKQHPLDEHWDAIVVGSGIGGLTAAALLSQHAAKKVLVLERHYTAGGYTHSFHRPGYSWDVGLHYIGDVQDPASPLRAAFDHLTGGQLEWAPMPDVYDRIVMGGRTFEFPTGRERLRARLKEYFPAEAAAIDHYFAAVQSAQKASGLYFAEKAVPRPIARLAGGLMRGQFLHWASRSTLDILQRITQNEDLIAVLTAQWGDYGLPPAQSSFGIHAIIAAHYFNGSSYPVGGAARIAETITPGIERNGGKLVVSAEVQEIIVQSGKATGVRMADGREFRADLVISDAGARNTFQRLVREPQPILHDLERIPGSLAHLSLYIGVKQSARELGLTGTNLWIYPSPDHGAPDHDANLARFLHDPSAPFPFVYISFPSAKDPVFEHSHPGRATLEAIVVAPYAWFAGWEDSRWKHRAADYDAFKQSLAERIEREVERNVPAVAGRIDHAELSTPLTTRHFMNYQQGEAYGLAATPERFRLRSLTPHTSIRSLYLTGQDVASLGVAGALFGGVMTASAVLGRNLMSIVTKPARAQLARRTAVAV